MPSKIKSKGKSRKQRHHTKISQKVIQKVIVKIGEDRKARKARRKQKRRYKREGEDAMLQQQQSVPATVVYNTGGAYQPLPFGQTVITPQPKRLSNTEYVEVEQPSGIIDIPTKREQLEEFIDPVAQDDIASTIYTEQIFNREKVEGNYAFGKPDLFSERPPSSLHDNELAFQPRFVSKDIGENLSEIGKSLSEYNSAFEGFGIPSENISNLTTEIVPKKRRTKQEIAMARYEELHNLYMKMGLSKEKADNLIDSIDPSKLPDEIKKVKAEIKASKTKGSKA